MDRSARRGREVPAGEVHDRQRAQADARRVRGEAAPPGQGERAPRGRRPACPRRRGRSSCGSAPRPRRRASACRRSRPVPRPVRTRTSANSRVVMTQSPKMTGAGSCAWMVMTSTPAMQPVALTGRSGPIRPAGRAWGRTAARRRGRARGSASRASVRCSARRSPSRAGPVKAQLVGAAMTVPSGSSATTSSPMSACQRSTTSGR